MSPSVSLHTTSGDPAFARLVDELLARLADGEPSDIDAWLAEHPEDAERLRKLLPSLTALATWRRVEELPGNAAPLRTLGDFQIFHELGRGGMGIVYEAEQISLGRRVALKVLPFAAVLDPRQLQRFKHEASAAAILRHPHIVGIHCVGEERGVYYYAMELIEGHTLAEVIQERSQEPGARSQERGSEKQEVRSQKQEEDFQPAVSSDFSLLTSGFPYSSLPPDTLHASLAATVRDAGFFAAVARLGIQAAEALDHAHAHGIVHRDIKPSNLMVDARAHLWVTDFGLAHIETGPNLTMTGDMLGTLRYMSPEQASGKPTMVDHRSDIYSLGATLYELATDRPVVRGQERAAILREIAETDPASPRKLTPNMPADLETILLKCLAKEPTARYDTAQALADDLRRFLEHRTIRAKRPRRFDTLLKSARRHRGFVLAVTLVLLALVSGIVGTTWGMIRAKSAEHEATRQEGIARLERAKALQQKSLAEEEAAISQAVSEFLREDLLAQSAPELNARDQQVTVEELLGRAAARIESKFQNQPRVEAAIRQTIGDAYHSLGNYPAAQFQLERALEIRREVLGDENAETLDSMSNLALLYQAQDQLAKAEPLNIKALALSRRVQGETHVDTVTSMNNLAALHTSKGEYTKAEPLFVEALEILRRDFGHEHPDTLDVMRNLAFLYQALGQPAKAQTLMLQTLEVTRRVRGNEHPDTLISMNNLGALYKDQKRFAEAEPLFIQSLEIRRRVHGKYSPQTFEALNNLATLYHDQGALAKAEPLFVEALDGLRSVKGPSHPHTCTTRDSLVNLYLSEQEFAKVEPLFKESYEIAKSAAAANDAPAVTRLELALGALVKVNEELHRPAEAAKWRQELDKWKSKPVPAAESVPTQIEPPSNTE